MATEQMEVHQLLIFDEAAELPPRFILPEMDQKPCSLLQAVVVVPMPIIKAAKVDPEVAILLAQVPTVSVQVVEVTQVVSVVNSLIISIVIAVVIIPIPATQQVEEAVMESQPHKAFPAELSGNTKRRPYAGMKSVSMKMEKLIPDLDVPG